MLKKLFSVLLCSSMLVASASSLCYAEAGDDGSGGVDKLVCMWVKGAGNADTWQAVFDQFEEETGIEVEAIETTNENFVAQLTLMISSGQQLDVCFANGQDLRYLYNTDLIQPVDETSLAPLIDTRFVEDACNMGTFDGHVYAVPYSEFTANAVYYRKDIFENLGLEIPTTMDEFYSVADVLKENGIAPFAMWGSEIYQLPVFYFNTFGQTAGGAEKCNDYLYNMLRHEDGYAWNDEVNVKALEVLQQMAEAEVFQDGYMGAEKDACHALFAQGQIAMFGGGTWDAQLLMDAGTAPEDLGVFLFPRIDDSYPNFQSGSTGNQAVIMKDAVDTEAAAALIEVATRSENVKNTVLMDTAAGEYAPYMMPIRDAEINNSEMTQFFSGITGIIANYFDWTWPPEMTSECQVLMQELLSGRKNAQEMADAMQDKFEELIDEGYVFDE